LDALVPGAVIVQVNKRLGLGTDVIFGSKVGWGAVLWKARNGMHAIKEYPKTPFAENAEAGGDGVLKKFGLRRLGWVKEEWV
jgi:hypothetical protein